MDTEIRLRVTGYAPAPTECLVRLEQIPDGRRIRGAVTSFVTLFLLALVSVLIPVAHFLLVPGFLIAAFATLFVKLGVTTKILASRGTCPDCQYEQDFDLSGAWKLPRDVTCRGCQRRLTVSAAPSPQG